MASYSPGIVTILKLTITACLPLLRPLVKTVVERHTQAFSSQSRQFASLGAENDIEELPLRLQTPKVLEHIHERVSSATLRHDGLSQV